MKVFGPVGLSNVPLISSSVLILSRSWRRFNLKCNYARLPPLLPWEGLVSRQLGKRLNGISPFHRYIELNPLRASMTDDPPEYRWSSYHHNALWQPDKLIESHADHLRLGTDPAKRQAAYRELFRAHIDPEMLKAMRQATQTNRVWLGAVSETD